MTKWLEKLGVVIIALVVIATFTVPAFFLETEPETLTDDQVQAMLDSGELTELRLPEQDIDQYWYEWYLAEFNCRYYEASGLDKKMPEVYGHWKKQRKLSLLLYESSLLTKESESDKEKHVRKLYASRAALNAMEKEPVDVDLAVRVQDELDADINNKNTAWHQVLP